VLLWYFLDELGQVPLLTEPSECSGEIGAQNVPLDGDSGGQSELQGAGNRRTRHTCTWDVIRGGSQETLAGWGRRQREPAAHARRRGRHHCGLAITSPDRCDPAHRTIALKRCCRHHLTTVGLADSTPRPLPERPHTPNKRDTGPHRKPPFRVSQARTPRAGERLSICPLKGAAAGGDAPRETDWARTRVVHSMACCRRAEWPAQPVGCSLKKDERAWLVKGDSF